MEITIVYERDTHHLTVTFLHFNLATQWGNPAVIPDAYLSTTGQAADGLVADFRMRFPKNTNEAWNYQCTMFRTEKRTFYGARPWLEPYHPPGDLSSKQLIKTPLLPAMQPCSDRDGGILNWNKWPLLNGRAGWNGGRIACWFSVFVRASLIEIEKLIGTNNGPTESALLLGPTPEEAVFITMHIPQLDVQGDKRCGTSPVVVEWSWMQKNLNKPILHSETNGVDEKIFFIYFLFIGHRFW